MKKAGTCVILIAIMAAIAGCGSQAEAGSSANYNGRPPSVSEAEKQSDYSFVIS
ncbi:MAG: hypothetical protein K6F91_01580 [Ruminococcus sp.]|nr:hypothetical protein [Ruminococcus sp.]